MNRDGGALAIGIEDEGVFAKKVQLLVEKSGLDESALAQHLGTSLVSVVRWSRGDTMPSAQMRAKIERALTRIVDGKEPLLKNGAATQVFASRGAKRISNGCTGAQTEVLSAPQEPLVKRVRHGDFWGATTKDFENVLAAHCKTSPTAQRPIAEGVSAGKNTYTYDAHTYHTKVPPQGIVEIIKHYLPKGGLVLDPFAGSGMTGVAARASGCDVVLNELSPAASFIADRFTRALDPTAFMDGVKTILARVGQLRRDLYLTSCRQCGDDTEILYTVWSYRVVCGSCSNEFLLWDHCRRYGKSVREHKILSEFPCPACGMVVKKSRLRRTQAEPVLVGYKCCSSYQVEEAPNDADLRKIAEVEASPRIWPGFTPDMALPDGVNLCQPKRHGLDTVASFYTARNLSAMSSLWREIHCVRDTEVAAFLGFAFTSLYQRVTKLSEFRFWGGSGNTANFNVPYIYNEANVFATFERKARSIQDHLETTARRYEGRAIVRTGSATDMSFLPSDSIDLIFTDPPFGGNINYSEMNILWESWLGAFTDTRDEAIVNRFQGKDVLRYGELMASSLKECFRVLREGRWMLLVFMNSSAAVWETVRNGIIQAGFSIERVDIFDKQHGTFKQFVSENTAGSDLILHCRKSAATKRVSVVSVNPNIETAIKDFLRERDGAIPKSPYLHVDREDEIDYRMLYSEFLASHLSENESLVGFPEFRSVASSALGDG